MAEITEDQQLKIDLLTELSYDTAAVKEAVLFIGDDKYKRQLFLLQFRRAYSEVEIVAKTRKAIQEAIQAIDVLDAKK